MCTSKEVFKNGNYNCIVLQDNLEKAQVKEREAYFISVFEHNVVNKNRPMLVDMKDYQRAYQRNTERNNELHD